MSIEITIRPGEGALSRAIAELPDNGESADTLAKEIWDFFCSVQ